MIEEKRKRYMEELFKNSNSNVDIKFQFEI